jgi:hypothetical protein
MMQLFDQMNFAWDRGSKSFQSGASERAGPATRKMPEFRKIQEGEEE